MGVAKELTSDDMRCISLNNLVIVVRIVMETGIVSRRNVANDPNSFSLIFSKLQVLNHPSKDTIWIL
jgi:hypothetical protein